eukprot:13052913-Alexandrium_andersonii.AAC.1
MRGAAPAAMDGPSAGLSVGLCVVVAPPIELGMVDSFLGVIVRAVGVDPLTEDTIYRVCLPARAR